MVGCLSKFKKLNVISCKMAQLLSYYHSQLRGYGHFRCANDFWNTSVYLPRMRQYINLMSIDLKALEGLSDFTSCQWVCSASPLSGLKN